MSLLADVIRDLAHLIVFFTAQCIDKYIALRSGDQDDAIDPRLQNIVERMFQRCIDDGEYKQAIGIALESKRLDVVEDVISKGNPHELLSFVIEVSMTLVQNLQFRNEVRRGVCAMSVMFIMCVDAFAFAATCLDQVLRLLVKLYLNLEEPDYVSVSQCLVHLNDPAACSDMLKDLVSKNTDVSEADHCLAV